MADALISIVLDQLTLYVQSQLTLVVDTRQNVLQLIGNLKLIQAILADAEQKQVKNEAVRLWLDDLKQVVYYADDVMDEWLTKHAISHIQSDVHVDAGSHKKVFRSWLLSPCFFFKDVFVRYDIGRQIEDINMRLDLINKQRIDFGLKVVEVHQNHEEPRRLTSSVVDVTKVHGRDHVKEDIMSRLLGEISYHGMAFRVIAIVGIGGMGKTTLARLIFNEERVLDIFKTKMWVCVSEPFNLVGVAKAIIKAAKVDGTNSVEWEEVHKCLCQSVQGKQFLLVLDDVWTEDPNHWSQLKLALNGGAPVSRIIVTTRNRMVAKIMGTSDHDIHDLEKLSDDDSWLVMRDVALVGKEDLKMFEKIGKEIAIKCKGVPLAITTLASLLCERQTKEDWKDVSESDLWEMPQIKQFLLPSLFLSYYSLASITKQCFLYCAFFPKDYELPKEVLIRLWMAQGFFGYGERRDLEKIGEYHFRILAMRSFFQDLKKDSDGRITLCKMHDLVHDFALHLSQNESFFLQDGDVIPDSDKLRHLFAVEVKIPHILKAKNLRTLFLAHESVVCNNFLGKLTCLRTLDLAYCVLEVLPRGVERLVQLRYLELSDTELLELPEAVCNLYNLQYLGLNRCRNLHKLPEKIGNLSNLRHLEIEETDALKYMPKTTAALSSLRTLSKFIVSGADYGCSIGDLQLLKNLQGGLVLNGLSRVTNGEEAIQANLNMKKHLREITFCFKEESGVITETENILKNLEPHEDLEILKISDYSASHFPGWVQSSSFLANVIEIRLNRCTQCTELPAFGKLAYLKRLVIKSMGSVIRIGNEFYGFDAQMTAFPKLRTLELEEFAELEEWEIPISENRKIMPLLSQLLLKFCPKLRALPHMWRMEALEELELEGLHSVKRVGIEFVGVVDANEGSLQDGVIFPTLRVLEIEEMFSLEEWSVPFITPHLRKLKLLHFPKLKTMPTFQECMKTLESLEISLMYEWEGQEKIVITDNEGSSGGEGDSCGLRNLIIGYCPMLRLVPDYIFSPSLEELQLQGNVGVLYNSFPDYGTLCSITRVHLAYLKYSWLPNGFDQLKSLQVLDFNNCKTLDFDLNELRHFTMLRQLFFNKCLLLEERFKGDDWMTILAHVPRIWIDLVEITKNR